MNTEPTDNCPSELLQTTAVVCEPYYRQTLLTVVCKSYYRQLLLKVVCKSYLDNSYSRLPVIRFTDNRYSLSVCLSACLSVGWVDGGVEIEPNSAWLD